jgi:hypothetical protein
MSQNPGARALQAHHPLEKGSCLLLELLELLSSRILRKNTPSDPAPP